MLVAVSVCLLLCVPCLALLVCSRVSVGARFFLCLGARVVVRWRRPACHAVILVTGSRGGQARGQSVAVRVRRVTREETRKETVRGTTTRQP